MVRHSVWGSTEINSRAISIQFFLCYLFYFLKSTDIASYADGTTRYNDNLIQKLVINDLRKHLPFFLNVLTTTT